MISIITPIYNRTWQLARLINKLPYLKINNPELKLEWSICTNGSPQETLQILEFGKLFLKSYNILTREISMPTPFGCATVPRINAIDNSNGEYLLFLDSDDFIIHSEKINLYKDDIGISSSYFIHPDDSCIKSNSDICFTSETLDLLSKQNPIANSGTLISRKLYDLTGGIDPSLTYCEDYDLWIKCAKQGAKFKPSNINVAIELHDTNAEKTLYDQTLVDRMKLSCK